MRFTPYSITTFNDAIAIKAAVEEKNGKMEHMTNWPHCWRVHGAHALLPSVNSWV